MYNQAASRFGGETNEAQSEVDAAVNRAMERGSEILQSKMFKDNRAFAKAQELHQQLNEIGLGVAEGRQAFTAAKEGLEKNKQIWTDRYQKRFGGAAKEEKLMWHGPKKPGLPGGARSSVSRPISKKVSKVTNTGESERVVRGLDEVDPNRKVDFQGRLFKGSRRLGTGRGNIPLHEVPDDVTSFAPMRGAEIRSGEEGEEAVRPWHTMPKIQQYKSRSANLPKPPPKSDMDKAGVELTGPLTHPHGEEDKEEDEIQPRPKLPADDVTAGESAGRSFAGLGEAFDRGMGGVGAGFAGYGTGDDIARQWGVSKKGAEAIGGSVAAVEGIVGAFAPEAAPLIMGVDLIADDLTGIFKHHKEKTPAPSTRPPPPPVTSMQRGNIALPTLSTMA